MESPKPVPCLADYGDVVGPEVIEEIRVLARRVEGRRMQNINSTPVGGGVAEILTRLVPLLNEVGVQARWDVMRGDNAFFAVTKAFHNALHGNKETITDQMLDVFRATTAMNLQHLDLGDDVIWIHDPQPAGLVDKRDQAGRKWVWRCHIDVSAPDPRVWNFLEPWIRRYDASIFSMPEFARQLSIPQFMVTPSIDPLAEKNRELGALEITAVLEKYGIDPQRPVLTQISRFDRLKDPLGVIKSYQLVKRRHDCQLVLAGGGATDDPEGAEVLAEVQKAAADDRDIKVLLLPPFSDYEINALVRGSTIVFQKSIREGFGLTVSEALWKGVPVIGGAVGGIRVQVIDGVTGFLVHSPEGGARAAARLLEDAELRRHMGENGRSHVRQNFLITRHLKDYLLVMLALEYPEDDVVTLQ
ncbi:MAG: glycosyltransferase [Bryobacterales bacterium]|nr:glycosyltransferase [Bryobacterales bacterium]